MGENSKIAWCDHTWNPWYGCTKISAGCDNCYMYRDMTRYGRNPELVQRAKPATFNAPLKWKEPARVFTCSWSDFFITDADAWRDEAWDIIRRTPHLTYQILTKRPALIKRRLPPDWATGAFKHCWVGVSVENVATASRIATLYAARFENAVPWVSFEPLLEDVSEAVKFYAQSGFFKWAVIGGESGAGARPFNLDWAYKLIEVCRAAGIAVFVKQVGANVEIIHHHPDDKYEPKWTGNFPPKDRAGADPEEWPEDLRIREWPVAA